MRTPRFHLPGPLRTGDTVDLPEPVFRHAVQVLRLRAGAPLILFDGGGGEYAARLCVVGRRQARAELGDFSPREAESPLDVTLAQAVSAGERMDFSLQKAVELGVRGIVPLLSERSAPLPEGERRDKRMRHWHGVIAGACEQSGRNRLARLHPPLTLAHWLGGPQATGAGLRLVLAPEGDTGLGSLTGREPPAGPVVVLVGPEGGLSGAELAQARTAGFTALRLGPRVLRTETAGAALLAALGALWGDLG